MASARGEVVMANSSSKDYTMASPVAAHRVNASFEPRERERPRRDDSFFEATAVPHLSGINLVL